MHRFLFLCLGLTAALLVSRSLQAQEPSPNAPAAHRVDVADRANLGSGDLAENRHGRVTSDATVDAPRLDNAAVPDAISPDGRLPREGVENTGALTGEQTSRLTEEINPVTVAQQELTAEAQGRVSLDAPGERHVVPQP